MPDHPDPLAALIYAIDEEHKGDSSGAAWGRFMADGLRAVPRDVLLRALYPDDVRDAIHTNRPKTVVKVDHWMTDVVPGNRTRCGTPALLVTMPASATDGTK